jgi:TolA-binding protein
MKIENSEGTPAPAAPHPEIARVRQLWDTHGRYLATGAAVAALVILGVVWFSGRGRSAEQTAAEMLDVAQNTGQLDEIRSQYPSTVSAQIASLILAKAQYDSGNYNAAMNLYAEFEKGNPNHPMLPIAKLGRVHCLDASGLTEEALAGYTAFVAANPDHFLAPDALFGQARTLGQLGRWPEAKIVYEDFIVAHPDSARVRDAQVELRSIEEKMGRPKGDS